ncbi:hypothetical protein PFISCL1PPCAC_23666 [Pristionchus fissidentatus]|uniref:NADAR domain-containing protein n=1 Tax=Pristionchus fissidentatus TaxID=1538716 RepID=A0AAV5WNS3_9BILA|nr:hypothetical protein PFISCL1PPCAC_23666 [Pristionchus fissidentatus]
MSTPATWRDIERSQKRRDRQDRMRSNQLSQQPRFSSRDQFNRPAPSNNWRNEPVWSQPNPGYMDFSNDSFAISNQMQMQSQPAYSPPNGMQYGQQPMMVAQPTQDFVDYAISPANIVLFHGRHFMSTLYKAQMVVEDFQYPSVEHYYQACKLYTLGGSNMALRMNDVREPSQCKSAVRQLLNSVNAPKKQIDQWRLSEAPEILVHANLHKFAQNPELRAKLMSTGDALLVHSFDKDDLYAIGMNEEAAKKWSLDNNGKHIQVPRYFLKEYFMQTNNLPTYGGKGKNLLGVILMMVREAFRPERGRADQKIVNLLNTMNGMRF